MKVKVLLYIMFTLILFNLGFAFNFQNAVLNSTNSELVVYFDVYSNQSDLSIQLSNLNYSYNYLKSTNGLYSDTFPNLEYPSIITNRLNLPNNLISKRYKLSLYLNQLNNNLNLNSSINFYRGNSNIFSFKLNSFKISSNSSDLDLSNNNFKSIICSFINNTLNSCDNIDPSSVNSNSSIYIQVPTFYNNSKISSISHLTFTVNPNSSEYLNYPSISGLKLKSSNHFINNSIIVYDNIKLHGYNSNNFSNNIFSSDNIYYINDFIFGNFSGKTNSLLYSTNTKTNTINNNIDSNLNNIGALKLSNFDSYLSSINYLYANTALNDYEKLNGTQKFIFILNSSWVSSDSGSTCALTFNLNKFGNPTNFKVGIHNINYTLSTSDVTNNNYHVGTSYNPNYNSIFILKNTDKLSFKNPNLKYDAKNCNLKIGAAYIGNIAGKDLVLKINSTNYTLNTSNLKIISSSNLNYNSNISKAISIININSSNSNILHLNNSWTNNNYSTCSLNLGVNYIGSKKDLYIKLGSNSHLINTNLIQTSGFKSYNSLSITSNRKKLALSNGDIKFNLNKSNLNAKTCRLSFLANYKGNKTNLNLNLNSNSGSYNINLSNLNTDNIESVGYANMDWTRENNISIGKTNTIDQPDLFSITTSNLVNNLNNFGDCNIKLNLCYQGSSSNKLNVFINSQSYFINSSDINSCDSYSDYTLPVSCSDLSIKPSIDLTCVNCSSSNYFKIGLDSSSSGISNSYFQNSTDVIFTSNLGVDPMIKLITNNSLNYNILNVDTQCLDLNSKNITFSCTNCNSNDDLNLIIDPFNTNTLTYQNNILSPFGSLSLGVNTSTNYDYSIITSNFSCSELVDAGNYIDVTCPSCDKEDYYQIPLFNSTSNNNFYYNNSFSNYAPYFNINAFNSVLNSYASLNTVCSNLNGDLNYELSCTNCDPSNTYSIFNDLTTNQNTLNFNSVPIAGNLLFDVYSNQSLLYSPVVLSNLDCSVLNDSISISCPNCDNNNYLNFIKTFDSSSHSKYGDFNTISGDLNILVQKYSKRSGGGFISLGIDGNLNSYDTNANLLWTKTIPGYGYRTIYSANIYDSKIGDEVIFANSSSANIYDSFGNLITTINNLKSPLFTVSNKRLLIINSDFTYLIFDGTSIISTSSLFGVGLTPVKILDTNIINSTLSHEYIFISKDNSNYYFTIFDNLFNVISTSKYRGEINDIEYDSKYPNSLLFLKNNGLSLYKLNILNGFSIYLNNSQIYSTTDTISSNFNTQDLSSKFNNYLSSISNFSIKSVMFPIKFIFNNLNKVSTSFNMLFETNFSNIITYQPYNNLVSFDKIIVNSQYFTSGTKLNYNNTFFDINVHNLSNLPGYIGGRYDFYNGNKKHLGSCFDSTGYTANLGFTNIFGKIIGCNLGYTINENRHSDYIMYANQTTPLYDFMGGSFMGGILSNKLKYNLNVNSIFNSKNFTNVYYFIHSFSNNSIYDKIRLNLNLSGNYIKNLNYTIATDCQPNKYLWEDNFDYLTSNYAVNNISNNLIYICANDWYQDGSHYQYDIFISKLSGSDRYSFDVEGEKNSRATLSNIISSKPSVYWNESFDISGNYTDLNGDSVNLTLQFLNPNSLNFTNVSNIFYSNSNGVFNFSNIKLDSSFIGQNIYYKFIISDVNSSNSTIGSTFSSLNTINVNPIPFNITKVDSGLSSKIIMGIFDNESNLPLNNVLCKFYVKISNNYDLYSTSFTNTSGSCTLDLVDLNPATYNYYVIAEKTNYKSTQSINYNQNFKNIADLLISLDNSYNITDPLSISARLIDINNNLQLTSANCILSINNKILSSAPTNSSTGICQFSSDLLNQNGYTPSNFSIGVNNLKINITGLDSTKYLNTIFSKNYNITLIDKANITVLSPTASTNFDPANSINLSASIKDSSSNNIQINNSFYWQYTELDSGETSVISSMLNYTWKIPNGIYGAVEIKAIFNDNNYGGKTVVTIPVSVKDGLKIKSLTSSKLLRLPNQNNKLEAIIVTGNDIPVNESSYNGTWGGYNCSWYLSNSNSNILIGNSTTNANGYCSYNFDTNCSYLISDYNLTVNLTGDLNAPSYPVLSNNDIISLNLYDDLSNASLKILNLSNTNISDELIYGNEYQLDLDFKDSCGVNLNTSLFDLEWFYKSNLKNLTTSLGIKDRLLFTPLSYMNGNSSLFTKILPNKYYNTSKTTEEVSILKLANINTFNVPEYLSTNTVNNITCGISIPGVINKSFYSVNITIDGTKYSVPTNSNGIATYSFDTTGMNKGQHEFKCSVGSYSSENYKIFTGTNNISTKFTILASNLKIYNNSVLKSNRDYYLAKSSAGNPVMPSGLTEDMVFRKSFNPFYEPEKMYFGISFATIGAPGSVNYGKEILLNGVNVTAYIYNNNTQSLITTLNCIQNLNEFSNRNPVDPKDVVDKYKSNYVCLLDYNPGNTPVGVYKVIINATMPGQPEWTSENFTSYFQVWGILNASIITPSINDEIQVNLNYSFKSSVKDEFGTSLNTGNAQVEYGLRDSSWNCGDANIGTTSISGADNSFTKIINLTEKVRYYIYDYRRNAHNWKIQIRAFAPYYKTNSILTAYDPQVHSSCDHQYLNQLFINETKFKAIYHVDSRLSYPGGASVIAPDDSGNHIGKLVFICSVRQLDNELVTNVPVTLSCNNCSSIPGSAQTKMTNIYGDAGFYLTPNSSDYDNSFNFTCSLSPYTFPNGNKMFANSNQTKSFIVVQNLGSGWGDLPLNYTQPTFNSFGIYSDASCNNTKTWFKSSETNSIYIGFNVKAGSSNITDFSITKAVGSSDGQGFDNSDNTGSYPAGTTNVSECVKYTPNSLTNHVLNYKFNINIVDSAGGGNARNNVPFYIDDVSPSISSVNQSKQYVKSGDVVEITVNMDSTTINVDGFADMKEVGLSANTSYSNKFNKISEGKWTYELNIPSLEGNHTYNIRALDKANYSDTKLNAFSIVVDRTPPSISSATMDTGCNNPHILGTVCMDKVNFRLSGTDANAIKKVSIKGTGSVGDIISATVNVSNYDSGTVPKSFSGIADGTYTITYSLTDFAGNQNISQIDLIKKTSGPSISVALDKAYLKSTTDTFNLNGPISEQTGYNVSSIKIDGADPSTSCTNLPTNSCTLNENKDGSSFVEGSNSINITAKDNLENPTTKILHITLDTINPTIKINSPLTQYLKGSFNVQTTITDTNRNNAAATYTLGSCNGSLVHGSVDQFSSASISSASCGYGNLTLIVNTTDLAGNTASNSSTIIIDNTLPVTNISYPLESSTIEGTIALNFSVKEDYLNTVEYKFDSSSYTTLSCGSPDSNNISTCNVASFDTTSKSDGSHTITLRATDLAGNIQTSTRTFTIDNNPPVITINKLVNSDATTYTSSLNNQYLSGNIKVYASITDAANKGNLSTYKCIIGSNSYSAVVDGPNYRCDISTSSFGDNNYTIKFSANDTLNHNSIQNITETFDNTAPNALNYTITPTFLKTTDSMSINFSSDETLKGNCEIYYSNSLNGLTNFIKNKTNSGLYCSDIFTLNQGVGTSGNKFITVRFTDLAGNTNIASNNFLLDNSAPSISYFNITNAGSPTPATNNLPGVSPVDIMHWNLSLTENNGIGNISYIKLHVISGINSNSSKYFNFTHTSGNNYIINNTLIANYSNGGAVENETTFEIVSSDLIGNIVKKNITIFISNAPPSIDNLTLSKTQVEVNVDSVILNTKITGSPTKVKFVEIKVIAPNGINWTRNYTINPSLYSTNNTYDFTPKVAGSYDVLITATNEGEKSSHKLYSDIFTAIGTTNAVLNYTPSIKYISSTYYNNPSVFNISLNLSNIGDARMLNSIITFASSSGIQVSPSSISCGPILKSNFCIVNTTVTIKNNIGFGPKILRLFVDWNNVDNSAGSLSYNMPIYINESNKIVYLNNKLENLNLEKVLPENIGQFQIRNNGNNQLSNISFSILNGTINDSNISFTFSQNPLSSLDINAISIINVNVSSLKKGNFYGYIGANASCSEANCFDSILTNISFYDKVKQNITYPSNNQVLFRDSFTQGLPFNCTISSYYSSNYLINHPTKVILNDGVTTDLTTINTDSLGKISYNVNLTQITPGKIQLSCLGLDDIPNYIRSSNYGNNIINLTLKGRLQGSLNYIYPTSCQGEIYYYDSHQCNNVNLSGFVVDEFGYPVTNTNITFYSNATQSNSIESIGSCITDLTGECHINWNPNVTVQGTFSTFANFSKNSYYTNDSINSNITIKGGKYVEIINPTNNTLNYLNNYIFDMRIKDSAGNDITDSLTYNVSWSLVDSLNNITANLSTNKTFNLTINSSFLGNYLLNVTVVSNNDTFSDINSIKIIRNTMNLTASSSASSLFRETDNTSLDNTYINISVNARDTVVNLNSSNVNLTFKLDNSLIIGNCTTNINGTCSISWDPQTNIVAGYHNISIESNKEFYINAKTHISNILLKVYVSPKWLSASTYSENFNNDLKIPLLCGILEYNTSSSPIDTFNMNYLKLNPGLFKFQAITETPIINNTQYLFNSTNADNVLPLGLNNGLNVTFTTKANITLYNGNTIVNDLNLNGFDKIQVLFKNLSNGVTYKLYGLNSSDNLELLLTSTQLIDEVNINKSKTYNNFVLEFTTTGQKTITLDRIKLLETKNTQIINIGEPELLGIRYTGSNSINYLGDFENLNDGIGFSSFGSKTSTFKSSSNYSFDKTKSLAISVDSLLPSDTFGFTWSTNADYSLANYVGLLFAGKNPNNVSLDIKVIFEGTGSCNEEYDLGNFTNMFTMPNINLSKYTSHCGNSFRTMYVNMTNIGSTPITDTIYLDRFEFLKKVTTNSQGYSEVNFHPYYAGYNRFSCSISSNYRYIVKDNNIEKVIKVIDGGRTSSSGNSARGASDSAGSTASDGSILSFETDLVEGDYIVPTNGLGQLDKITIFNNLNTKRIFNISSDNQGVLSFGPNKLSSTIINLEDSTLSSNYINIYLNTTNVSVDNLDMNIYVTDISTKETLSIPISFTIVPFNVTSPMTINNDTNLIPNSNLTIGTNIEYNSSSSNDNILNKFNYKLLISKNKNIYELKNNLFNINNGYINVNGINPFINSNLTFDINLRTIYGGEN